MTDTMRPQRTDPFAVPVPEELRAVLGAGGAVAWRQPVVVPTYQPDEPARFPMYLDRRVYQGSSGRVYPLPFIEGVARTAEDREWDAIHLENRYLRLTVLPEIGGRIHIGLDKTTGYDFLYRNRVIKPALVGLTGPWISGGVEFNWPQHHRPGTFLPVQAEIEQHDDGSVTVWCSDHDPFARMQATHGVRLHPDRAVVEVVVRLHNRTSERQTFLWWANAAVRVHDEYQSFFPTDVRYVADHARRAITAFPAADRPYYGVDYPAREAEHPGADRIDFYRNIPVPTSYMIVDSQQSFFGGYDHAAQAGVVHVADRGISPGKKQWTWGNAPFGHAWDRHLTDDDGPYVELMAGVYTDNQPDFSWLMPGEVRRFSQLWYPIPSIGPAHAAGPDAALHVDVTDGGLAISVAGTRSLAARLVVRDADGSVLSGHDVLLEPGRPERVDVAVASATDPHAVRIELLEGDDTLVTWEPADAAEGEPWVATEPPAPDRIATVEELYLTGLHLAQYRHPTRSPEPYWDEALRRDPGDSRTHLVLAERLLRAGDVDGAIEHARAALRRVTVRNENPRDAEIVYVLGVALAAAGEDDEALRMLAKAGWDRAWMGPAALERARILARRSDVRGALEQLDAVAAMVAPDPRADALGVLLLRRIGRDADAASRLARARAIAPGDVTLGHLDGVELPDDAGLVLDLANELAADGDDAGAAALAARAALLQPSSAGNPAPVARYLEAAALDRLGRTVEAAAARAAARATDRRWCFPAGWEAQQALRAALAAEPDDAVAALLLGMLLYDADRRPEAVDLWRRAVDLRLDDPVLFRNAGLAAYNVEHDDRRAWELYERAAQLAPDDARLLSELDQLAERLGHPIEDRLARLAAHDEQVRARDDLSVRYAGLLTRLDRAAEALDRLESRVFQPWEGGEGQALAAWDDARAALGLPLGDPPASLGEARPIVPAPAPVHESGETDYFATSLPQSLLFWREERP
jgi:tetratricopeptide (TPR) repeat protein